MSTMFLHTHTHTLQKEQVKETEKKVQTHACPQRLFEPSLTLTEIKSYLASFSFFFYHLVYAVCLRALVLSCLPITCFVKS